MKAVGTIGPVSVSLGVSSTLQHYISGVFTGSDCEVSVRLSYTLLQVPVVLYSKCSISFFFKCGNRASKIMLWWLVMEMMGVWSIGL